MKSVFSVQNNVVNVCCPYLSMLFLYIGNVKYPHGRTYRQQRFKSKRRKIANDKDCVAFHKTTAYHCCHFFSPEASRIFHSVMNDSCGSALPAQTDDKDVSQDSCCFFSGLQQGRSQDFSRGTPDFSTSSCAPPPPPPNYPTANLNIFQVPLLEVGLTVVSQSIFAVYEMTQPLLKFCRLVRFIQKTADENKNFSAL